MAKEKNNDSQIAVNRKARYEYFIREEIEAGIVLLGSELKPVRAGRVNIADSYASYSREDDGLWLYNAHIEENKNARIGAHEPTRPRKLLLHKRQMNKLLGQIRQKGYTLIPLRMYFNKRGIAKIMLGLGEGKKQYEKRDAIKERDWKREKAALMKRK